MHIEIKEKNGKTIRTWCSARELIEKIIDSTESGRVIINEQTEKKQRETRKRIYPYLS